MKSWEKILIVTLVSIMIVSIIAVYAIQINKQSIIPLDEISFKNIYFNESKIFVDVQSIHGNIQFNGIQIKDTSGNMIENTVISDFLLEGQRKTISINFNHTLSSEKYIVCLTTTKHSTFFSIIS
jgi:hypothetical protein